MSDPLTEAQLDDEAAPPGTTSVERLTMDRTLALLAEGQIDEAIGLLDEHTGDEGASLAVRALRAKLDYVGGHFASAAMRYGAIAVEAEDLPALRLNEALCLLRADRFDDAFAVLFRLLTRGITSPRLWTYVGAVFEHRRQYPEAAAAYLAGDEPAAARRMRMRKLDSTLAREGALLDEPPEQRPKHDPTESDQLEDAGATRGIEALRERETGQRTAPPTRFESHVGDTELPRSFAGLLAEPGPAPEGVPEAGRSARTLLDLTLAALLVVPSDASWTRHPSGLVAASATASGPVFYDTRAFVARSRATEPHSMRGSGASKGFTKLDLGRLLLGPRVDGETLHLLDLAGESLIVHDRYVVAFGADPQPGSNGHEQPVALPERHDAPWPLEMLRFSGEGMLVLGLPDSILTYDVRSGDDFELRAASLIGWAGELEVFLDGEATAGSARRVRFAGNGTVLLLTRPFATTSSIIPRTAGVADRRTV